MKFEEVLPLARDEGKKIRRKGWDAAHTLAWRQGSQHNRAPFVCPAWGETGVDGPDLAADDWEVLEECPHKEGTNEWAAWMLERKKRVARGIWNGSHWLIGDGWSASIMVVSASTGEKIPWTPSPTDLAATDWREVPNE